MVEHAHNRASSYRVMGAALLFLVLAGCVGGNQTVKRDYRFKPDERKGLGVLSVEVNDQCGKETPVLHYRAAESKTDKRRELTLDEESKGNASGFPQGWLFVQEEEPGDFLFTHVSYGKVTSARLTNTPVTFTNGKVGYLGSLQVSIPSCDKVSVRVIDRSDRDYTLFENHMTYFRSKYVEKQVINSH